MATVQNQKERFSKTEVVFSELKTSVVKDKPLIHTVEEKQR